MELTVGVVGPDEDGAAEELVALSLGDNPVEEAPVLEGVETAA